MTPPNKEEISKLKEELNDLREKIKSLISDFGNPVPLKGEDSRSDYINALELISNISELLSKEDKEEGKC
jgi:hypothetical protein